ncbi:MAG: arginyltransferase [Candidatus Binatia bacterium]|nr:arginyltransferase [Candidatus Binatia bacterium]
MNRGPSVPRRIGSEPTEWIVHDELSPCVYLDGEVARLPLRLPVRPLRRDELAARLHDGDRRQGLLLYRPHCPTCSACEAIRLDVTSFRPSRSQRRAFRTGESVLDVSLGPPTATDEKVDLYNLHKLERGLAVGDDLLDLGSYREFLVESCTETVEIEYRLDGKLVAVALTDRATDGLSAVYAFFDPTYSSLSLGTYSILKQLALCREWGLQYLYLGLYVAGSPPMAYKTRYRPHERRIDGVWEAFD